MTYIVDIRQRRQITLPKDLLSTWNLSQGDQLRIEVKDNREATLIPQKQLALSALKEIQAIFAKSRLSQDEFART